MVKKAIKIILITEFLVLFSYFISFHIYINIQVAFLSSLFVIIGSAYGYKKMVDNQIDNDMISDERDLLDEIEDPYELYDDKKIDDKAVEELDLKQVVKEERAKIKTFSTQSIKKGVRGGVSAFRLVPYLFLVLGFIALKNNQLLDIAIYLPSLAIGIVVGNISSKMIFSD